MQANEMMAEIHNHTGGKFLVRERRRMPAILRKDEVETWLAGAREAAKNALKPFPSEEMIARPVSTRVNTPRNNGPELIQPADIEPPKSVT